MVVSAPNRWPCRCTRPGVRPDRLAVISCFSAVVRSSNIICFYPSPFSGTFHPDAPESARVALKSARVAHFFARTGYSVFICLQTIKYILILFIMAGKDFLTTDVFKAPYITAVRSAKERIGAFAGLCSTEKNHLVEKRPVYSRKTVFFPAQAPPGGRFPDAGRKK